MERAGCGARWRFGEEGAPANESLRLGFHNQQVDVREGQLTPDVPTLSLPLA